jgi:hypothetical protein
MDQDQPAPLNSAQINAIQARMIAEFQRTVDDIELRKIAIEAAVKITDVALHADSSIPIDPIALARNIHAFLIEPFAEITVTVT